MIHRGAPLLKKGEMFTVLRARGTNIVFEKFMLGEVIFYIQLEFSASMLVARGGGPGGI